MSGRAAECRDPRPMEVRCNWLPSETPAGGSTTRAVRPLPPAIPQRIAWFLAETYAHELTLLVDWCANTSCESNTLGHRERGKTPTKRGLLTDHSHLIDACSVIFL